MSVIPSEYSDILESKGFAHIATIGPSGEPQSNPVWFDYDGEFIKISQTPDKQKYRNLERDNRIALSILDPSNPYRYLEIRGTVAKIDPDPDKSFINSLAKKYMDVDEYPYNTPEEVRVIVYIEPAHTTSM